MSCTVDAGWEKGGLSMTDQEKEQKNAEMKPEKEQAEYTPSVQPDFLREKIKQKPVKFPLAQPVRDEYAEFFNFKFLYVWEALKSLYV